VLLAAVALVATACGGSSATTTSTTTAAHVVATHPVNTRKAKERRAAAARERPVKAQRVHHPLPGTGSSQINDDNPGRADTGGHLSTPESDPCQLVTAAQAREIVGGPVGKPVEAPLGPTCIYRSLRDGRVITMSIEAANFARIKKSLRGAKSASMAGHTAYCGTYGQPTTLVSLGKGRVLSVTAPCAVGFRFAANALPHLLTA